MEILNFEKILAYYERRLPLTEEQEIEEAIFSNPESILILLGLKRIEEELSYGRSISSFLEEKQEELRRLLFGKE